MDETEGQRVELFGEAIEIRVERFTIFGAERPDEVLKAVLTKMIKLPSEERAIHPPLGHERAGGWVREALMKLGDERDGVFIARLERLGVRGFYPIFKTVIAKILEDEHARLEIDRVDLRDIDAGRFKQTRDL